jgi:GDP-L-fucose synthase
MKKNKIFVAGHKGLVGTALIRQLSNKKDNLVITEEKKNLDLTNQSEVNSFFKRQKINQVYLAAAKVGGIYANNSYPANFIYENLMIQSNVIHNSFLNGVKKLLFLGSSCIYPKNSRQPISEEDLLSGKLESTNEPYAIAKIAGIKMCESYNRQYGKTHNIDYRSILPSNLYGPGDNYHAENSHVIPGLIHRFHKAKTKGLGEVVIWGTGKPKREFMYVDDMARASVYLMNLNKKTYEKYTTAQRCHINIGLGKDLTIQELAEIIREIVDYKGKIVFDPSKPDGTIRKLLNSTRINKIGFKPEINLKEGLKKTYEDYLSNLNE